MQSFSFDHDRVSLVVNLSAHEDVGALVADNADNVAEGDVEHRERLDAHVEQTAKDLDLVFGNQLRERNEEADLEGRQAVVRHAVAVRG